MSYYFEDTYKNPTEQTETKNKSKKEQIVSKLNKVGDTINTRMNKNSSFLANKIVKKPSNESSTEVYEKYKKDFQKWKTGIKFGQVLLFNTLAVGPMDVLYKISIGSAITNSNDPTDKAVIEILGNVKDSFKMKFEKIKQICAKSKDFTKEQYDKAINLIESLGATMAKTVDKIKSGGTVKEQNINESSFELIPFFTNDGNEPIEVFEAVNRFIKRADYNNNRDIQLAEKCIRSLTTLPVFASSFNIY